MRGKYVEINKDLLLETYEKCGRSLNQTGKILGISAKTIKRRFDDCGLKYDPKIQHSLNENYFDELNEQSVYWLGFLATDGNVSKRKNSYYIRLGLATADIEHLKKFRAHLNFTGPIYSYIVKKNTKCSLAHCFKQEQYYSSVISLTSKKIFDRLADFNIVPAKTHILQFPEQLKNHSLLPHFIRGCIDGDGWIREHNNNNSEIPTEVRIGMCGTENFVNQTFEVIKSTLNINGGTCNHITDTNSWSFEFSALHDVDKIIDWLYKDATIFLERKYEIAKLAKGYAARYTPIIISKNELEQLYIDHGSIRKVAQTLEIDPETVKRRLLQFDIQHTTKLEHSYNEQFFLSQNESEIQFYWAGYLAGKSTLVIRDNKVCYLSLSGSEKDHLQLFLDTTQMVLPINDRVKDNKYTNYYLNIHSDKIISDLQRFNINADKEMNYSIPDFVLNSPLLKHFMRGYLDAKSSLANYGKLSLKIVNSKDFLEKFQIIVQNNCRGTFTASIKENVSKTQYQIIYLSKQAQSILDWLYQDATVFLSRKREIAMIAG